jgi:hypothetical protein
LNFSLTKKLGLVWIATEFFQRNNIHKSGFIFIIILIREYFIQHQDMKEPLQQSYRNIALGSKAFI